MIGILKNKKILALIILLVGILSLLIIITRREKQQPAEISKVVLDESSYPESVPQNFKSINNQRGVLIVDSNPEGARVTLDPSEEEVSETEILINITPFKVSKIPVGKHTISLFKEGFALETQEFQIESDKTTRLNIQLQPIEGVQKDKSWITKLPIQSKYYFVEYDNKRNIILAIINLHLEGQVEQEKEIDLLKDEVLDKLTIRGVDLTTEKVEWVIK